MFNKTVNEYSEQEKAAYMQEVANILHYLAANSANSPHYEKDEYGFAVVDKPAPAPAYCVNTDLQTFSHQDSLSNGALLLEQRISGSYTIYTPFGTCSLGSTDFNTRPDDTLTEKVQQRLGIKPMGDIREHFTSDPMHEDFDGSDDYRGRFFSITKGLTSGVSFPLPLNLGQQRAEDAKTLSNTPDHAAAQHAALHALGEDLGAPVPSSVRVLTQQEHSAQLAAQRQVMGSATDRVLRFRVSQRDLER